MRTTTRVSLPESGGGWRDIDNKKPVDAKGKPRIFISHGHIDHYGCARAAQEESGAPVFAHPRDHDKVTGRDRSAQRLDLYAAYLDRLDQLTPDSRVAL